MADEAPCSTKHAVLLLFHWIAVNGMGKVIEAGEAPVRWVEKFVPGRAGDKKTLDAASDYEIPVRSADKAFMQTRALRRLRRRVALRQWKNDSDIGRTIL